MKVLVIEDDLDLLDVLTYALRREGFTVIGATDGVQGLERWQQDSPDVVVLDIVLPRLSGLDVCKRIREQSATPVLLLSGKHEEEEIISGFANGADDYVSKPFSPRQLAMRLRALWRRGRRAADPDPKRQLELGQLVLDLDSHEVELEGRPIALTPLEFRLLWLLGNNPGRVVQSGRLVDFAWGYGAGASALLKTHISHLRKKLRLPAGGLEDIESVPQVGYRLVLSNKPRQRAPKRDSAAGSPTLPEAEESWPGSGDAARAS